MKRWKQSSAAVAAMLALTGLARAQQLPAAALAPAATAVYIQVDDFSSLYRQWQNDPLQPLLMDAFPRLRNQPPIIQGLAQALQMTPDEVVDKYFGKSAVVMTERTGDGAPAVVALRIDQADLDEAAPRVQLRKQETQGSWTRYLAGDGNRNVAAGQGWLLLADRSHSAWFDQVLATSNANSLVEDAAFKQWTARLPAQRTATLYVNDAVKDEHHALAAVRIGTGMKLHYAGQGPQYKELLSKVSDAKRIEFGPLPASTLAAVALNLKDNNPRETRPLDNLLAPKTLKKDVLPHLASPVVLFLGEVPGQAVEPKMEVAVPVLGAAIRLKDAGVAADLTRVFDQLMAMANFATIQWKTDPVLISDRSHMGVTYRHAALGLPLAQRSNRPELRPLGLSYGLVADYYLAATLDPFFQQSIAAAKEPAQSLAHAGDFKAMNLQEGNNPIGSAFVRTQPLAAHLRGLASQLQKWEEQGQQAAADSQPAPPRRMPRAEAERRLKLAAQILEQFTGMSMQVRHDGDVVLAEMTATRP